MYTISLQFPESIFRKLTEMANHDGVSVNQFVVTAAAEKLSAMETVEYLRKRAGRSTQSAFEKALSEIPDVEPEDYDKL